MKDRATLIDVARAAGVSRATASRVLGATSRNVDPALAERVRGAAESLGYRPHAVARALRTGSTGTVGLVVPSIRNAYFVGLIEAVTRASVDAGSSLLLADSQGDLEIEANRLDTMLAAHVDGIAIVPAAFESSGAAIARAATRVPVVQVDRWARGAGCPALATDNAAAIELLVDHLHATGRHRIALVGAAQTSSAGAERIDAFRRLAGEDMVLFPDFTTDAGRQAAEALLARDRLPDAVLCTADVLALGVATTLARAGVAIPGEVAITGFDDTDLLQLVEPPITSTRHPMAELAQRVLSSLREGRSRSRADDEKRRTAAQGGGENEAGDIGPELLRPTLVVRESTAVRHTETRPVANHEDTSAH